MIKYNNLNYSDNFKYCYGPDNGDRLKIEKLVLHPETKIIGDEAFLYCENLKEIICDGNLELIKLSAFEGCINLEKVFLKSSNTIKIETSAFYNCGTITDFNSTDIDFDACGPIFDIKQNVNNLTLNIRKDICYPLFASKDRTDKPSYEHITVNSDKIPLKGKSYKDFLCYLVEPHDFTMFYYPPENKENIIEVPTYIKKIDSYAFEYNPFIKEIHIDKNVNFISHSAFKGLDNLENIYINSDDILIRENVYVDCPKLKNIYLSQKAYSENFGESKSFGVFKPASLDVLIQSGRSFKEINNFYKEDILR